MAARQQRIFPVSVSELEKVGQATWLNFVLKNGSTVVGKIKNLDRDKITLLNLRLDRFTLDLSELEEIWIDHPDPVQK